MTSPKLIRVLGVLGILAALAAACGGVDKSTSAAGGAAGDAAAGSGGAGGNVAGAGGSVGGSCLYESDCGASAHCEAGRCAAVVSCTNSLDCVGASGGRTVCDRAAAECVACLADTDCATNERCMSRVCRRTCLSDNDCTPLGVLCDPATRVCMPCVENSDCEAGYACEAGNCVRAGSGGAGGAGGGGGAGGIVLVDGSGGGCTVARVPAPLAKAADVVIAVDNSGSMTFEAAAVQQSLNSFAATIAASGASIQVALISSYPSVGNGICIDAPLGSGGCPTQDTNLPEFLHVNQEVGSRNALELVLSTYGQWQTISRSIALKHVIVVSDDNATLSASDFDTQFKALDASHAGYKFHGIFAFTSPFASGTPCYDVTLSRAAAEGTVYRELVQMTGGASGDLCLQDLSAEFGKIATAIAGTTSVSCELAMPTTDAGAIDPFSVKLEFSSASTAVQTWSNVSDASACTATSFYYEQPPDPTKIILCPAACSVLRQASSPTLDVVLGCF